ncbi:uncharacterized protein PV09_07332 [Verruconis gallopava]|uniref:Uncharacterized protein n=1 Tax=Verruconis gallopava TaxID=253628 RepID=A0A0D1YK91_9PEZI|nr:uncharacterized protein PV09_07332 [Verruconis gallopava]KIW01292.1 hypothetical protein PV09_07332 [Verruconis gallopava]
MTVFKKRPQLQNVCFVSPPSTEIIHTYPEDSLADSERAAKRRRIEAVARDVLKERDVFIASASLRGPFESGWVNPWKLSGQHSKSTITNATAIADSRDEFQRQGHDASAIPDSVTRHTSRRGSEYCHDWLRNQKNAGYSSDLGGEVNVALRDQTDDDFDEEHTNSRYFLGNREPRKSPDIHARQRASTIAASEFPPKSLKVNGPSSGANRSNSEQPPRKSHHGILGAFYDTGNVLTLSKVSMISDDKPVEVQRTEVELRKADQTLRKGPDLPGFVFKDDEKKRQMPRSKGPNQSRASKATTTSTHELHDPSAHIPASIANVASVKENQELAVGDHESLAQEGEMQEVVAIYTNDEGRWPCPLSFGPNRPKAYASRSGVRNHLKNKHGINHTTLTKSKDVAAEVSEASIHVTEPDDKIKCPDKEERASKDNSHFYESVAEELHQVEEDPVSSSSATVVSERPSTTQRRNEPSEQLRPREHEKNAQKIMESVLSDQDDVQFQAQESDVARRTFSSSALVVDHEHGDKDANLPSNKTTTELPNRQDSRAYSMFTCNAEMSTQTELLRAHLAFQETQSAQKAGGNSADYNASSAEGRFREGGGEISPAANIATPFRCPDIPSFFNRPQPASLARVGPASTQDLMDAAADLSWSTVKKPTREQKMEKKRISFAGWPQTKPSLQSRGFEKEEERSPLASNTPLNPTPRKDNVSSQPPITTPAPKSVLSKHSRSFPATYQTSDPARTLSSFMHAPRSSAMAAQSTAPSAPSALPIPSYQEAQGPSETGYDSQEIEEALDMATSFLSTWDVDREVERNGVQAAATKA